MHSLVLLLALQLFFGATYTMAASFVPTNQAFRDDRASLHFFANDEEYPRVVVEEGTYLFNPDDMAILRPHLRRGDILENILSSGERALGLYIYDGEKVVELDGELDDYGNIPKEFVVFKDFNPNYWDLREMNYHNVLVPTQTNTQAYWHSGHHPRYYQHVPAILQAPGLEIDFQGQVYPLEEGLKEWLLTVPMEKQERVGFLH